MNLSIKVFFIILLTFLIIIISITGLSYTVVLSNYQEMEDNDIKKQVIRTKEALSLIKESFANITIDWAHWDDAYQFLVDKNKKFIRVNLNNKGSFEDTRSNFIMFYNNQGRYFAGNGFDSQHKQFIPVSSALLAFISAHPFLLSHQSPKDTHTGFIQTPEGLMLLSTYAVSNSASDKPSNGNVVFAYFFEKKQLDRLAQTLQVDLELYYLDNIANNPVLQNVFLKLGNQDYYLIPENNKILYFYTVLKGINDKPIALLRTTFHRTTYQEGLSTVHLYIVMVSIIGLIIMIIAQLLLRFSILGRINAFKHKLSEITSKQDFSKRIEMSGKDEIYDMVENCNKMLDVIDATKEQLNVSIQELTKTNSQIKDNNEKLKEREHAMVLINKINEKLQMCQNITEAYSIISETANELFIGWSGGIAITNPNSLSGELTTVTQWGHQKILKETFPPNECWAIRRGNIYIVDKFQPKIDCHHFTSNEFSKYICIPLIVAGKFIGILNLNAEKDVSVTDYYSQQLAITLSEVIALSVVNISLRDSLREQSIHDPLTSLFNRRYLEERFPLEMERMIRNKSVLSVGMIDIDFFKKFNDNYGHNAGDEALKQIGLLLSSNFRGYDLTSRFGGEEFVVVLVDNYVSKAYERMQAFREQVKNTPIFFNHAHLPPVTVSIGLAEAPADGSSLEEIVRKADQALYYAKNNGRDRVDIYTESKTLGNKPEPQKKR